MKKNIIVGNWKMNLDLEDARKLIVDIRQSLKPELTEQVDIVFCPSMVHISSIAYLIPKNTFIGAQNCFWEDFGAYTGEVSAKQLADIKCKYVILGHSERRMYLGENYINVNKKILACLNSDLFPILCVGESQSERSANKTEAVIDMQLRKALRNLSEEVAKNIIIAYEPIWAIGTGNFATPEDAEAVAKFIKKIIAKLISRKASNSVRVIYGGSVDHKNIASFIKEKNIDGSLVGGASVKASSFVNIIKNSLK